MSVLSSSAVLAQVTLKFNALTAAVSTMKAENKAKELSLTRTIKDMKRKACQLQDEVRSTNSGGTAALFGNLRPPSNPSLTAADRQHLAAEVVSQIHLSRYALKVDIPSHQAYSTGMSRYVTHSELHEFDFVNNQRLGTAITAAMNTPSAFELRVKSLEKEVLEPGGAFVRMELEIRSMQTKKAGDAVSAGTYTFKDQRATGVWAATIGTREIVKYFVDARQ